MSYESRLSVSIYTSAYTIAAQRVWVNERMSERVIECMYVCHRYACMNAWQFKSVSWLSRSCVGLSVEQKLGARAQSRIIFLFASAFLLPLPMIDNFDMTTQRFTFSYIEEFPSERNIRQIRNCIIAIWWNGVSVDFFYYYYFILLSVSHCIRLRWIVLVAAAVQFEYFNRTNTNDGGMMQ